MENSRKSKRKPTKPRNRFTICCFCLGSSTSDVELNVPFKNNESYDYVVEKLAIKKVPITLFATDEDLIEIENINSNNTGEYKVTHKDKKSATHFSTYYSKIPKNGKNSDSSNESQLNEKFNKPLNKKASVTIAEAKHKPQNYKCETANITKEKEIVSNTVTAEIHTEPPEVMEVKKSLKITPQLQETLNELGSKQRPEGSPSIKYHTRVVRPSTETFVINTASVDQNIPEDLKKINTTPKIKETDSEIAQNAAIQQKILNKIMTSQNRTNNKRSNEKLLENGKNNMQIENDEINSFLNNLALKSGSNQKWKIIIKEHGDLEGTDDRSTTDITSDEYSSGTETVSETE